MMVIIGDSHTMALRKAAEARGETLRIHWLNRGKGASAKHGDLLVDDAQTLVQGLTPEDILVLSLVGTQHNILGLLLHDRPFDVCVPNLPAPSEDIEQIPYHTLRSHFLELTKSDKVFCELCEKTPARVAVLTTPPPKNRDDLLMATTARYRGVELTKASLNPAQRRARLWHVEMQAVALAVDPMGGTLLWPPSHTMDADGLLKDRFAAADATHANEAYGSGILDQLAGFAAQ